MKNPMLEKRRKSFRYKWRKFIKAYEWEDLNWFQRLFGRYGLGLILLLLLIYLLT